MTEQDREEVRQLVREEIAAQGRTPPAPERPTAEPRRPDGTIDLAERWPFPFLQKLAALNTSARNRFSNSILDNPNRPAQSGVASP
jgi:hypothetical protein